MNRVLGEALTIELRAVPSINKEPDGAPQGVNTARATRQPRQIVMQLGTTDAFLPPSFVDRSLHSMDIFHTSQFISYPSVPTALASTKEPT
jgi:lysine/ornithine N-monooxygenase